MLNCEGDSVGSLFIDDERVRNNSNASEGSRSTLVVECGWINIIGISGRDFLGCEGHREWSGWGWGGNLEVANGDGGDGGKHDLCGWLREDSGTPRIAYTYAFGEGDLEPVIWLWVRVPVDEDHSYSRVSSANGQGAYSKHYVLKGISLSHRWIYTSTFLAQLIPNHQLKFDWTETFQGPRIPQRLNLHLNLCTCLIGIGNSSKSYGFFRVYILDIA